MSEQHTPGPWVARKPVSPLHVLISANAEDVNGSKNGGIYVARSQGPDAVANSRLIAAAPDLLAIAQRILDRGYVSSSIEEEREDHNALAAAIALATTPARNTSQIGEG